MITGGAGFIGSHLADRLLAEGYSVRVLDTLARPGHNGRLPPWFPKKAQFIRGDVRSKVDWARALSGVDFVFHLAAYMDFHPDFSTYVATNVMSVALLFEAIRDKKFPVKKIIMASSQSVYGEGKYRCGAHGMVYPVPRSEAQMRKQNWEIRCPRDHAVLRVLRPVAQKEDDLSLPITPYGASKRAGEDMLFALGRLDNIPSVALRYTIVLGPRQSFRHFYSGALRQLSVMALGGHPMAMHEDGNQLRDFIHVDDVIDAHLLVLKNPKADFRTFNVGSGKPVRITDMARTIARTLGIPFRPHTSGVYRMGTARHSLADVSRLKKLGWRPRRTLGDSVTDYLAWIKNYPEAKKHLRDTLQKMESDNVLRNL